MFSPSVITSKAAQDDLLNIKSAHADLVKGLSLQATRLQDLNTQKQAELQSQNTMKMEMDKARMVSDTAAQKNSLDFAARQAELDIRRSELSMKV